MKIHTLSILGDHKNYAYIIETNNGSNAVIDPGEADPIIRFCEDKSIHITHILLTHHHWDHVNGTPELIKKYDPIVVGPNNGDKSINHLNKTVKDTHSLYLGEHKIETIALPGHTMDHIAYYFIQEKMLFSGDVLFGGGCGKVFEGTHSDMWHSLEKIKALPDHTKIYFGHEYTLSNLEFGQKIEPNNLDIQKRIEKTRTPDFVTTPTTLKLEKETNVFLRAKNAAAFSEIRTQKDNA